MADTISVLLIDDQPLFVQYLLRFLATEPRIDVVGVAHRAAEGVALCQTLQPQVVLLDLSMPGQSGLDVLPELRAAAPKALIIVLTSHDSAWYQEEARSRGANAFVSKNEVSEHLLEVILGQNAPNPNEKSV
ncbi:response regulator [Rhodothermus bifroesti]|jgi:DNA-binding NarL/FixJ family response regulator|uniref:Response regulator transcription factor n=1 Tax=Rhodothermus marinus TaxID=29549 RepID=A0A7V2AZH6_RHOMR|nr:response regulator transcription factor [Rhodothermus bifroesti]GBD02536.1 DNA-binding transcriptional activator EvgA [bacterium HR18]